MIMSLKQRKIKFEPRIKLNHNIPIDIITIQIVSAHHYVELIIEFIKLMILI